MGWQSLPGCAVIDKGYDFKWRNSTFRLGSRRIFFTVRAVRHWDTLPEEGVDALSLEVFKVKLEEA